MKMRGFTLIELLVAIGVMALMAGLSWRGIDGMARTQTQLAQRTDQVMTLQAGLAQWATDLDALVQYLNTAGPSGPNGQAWTPENYQQEMARLAAA